MISKMQSEVRVGAGLGGRARAEVEGTVWCDIGVRSIHTERVDNC